MPQEPLTLDVQTTDDGATQIFVLHGTMDIATSPTVRAALIEAAEHGKHDVVVDLTNLEFVDSTGLGALIGAHKRAKEHGGRVRLVVRDGQILRLLRITGLLSVFSAYPTLEDALTDTAPLAGL
jgi:anti-sigma B factor antagonist